MTHDHDLYELLGVSRDATVDEIKAAYHHLAERTHPDKGGTGALFRQIRDAYETLGDPQRRADYDRACGDPGRSSSGTPPPGPGATSTGGTSAGSATQDPGETDGRSLVRCPKCARVQLVARSSDGTPCAGCGTRIRAAQATRGGRRQRQAADHVAAAAPSGRPAGKAAKPEDKDHDERAGAEFRRLLVGWLALSWWWVAIFAVQPPPESGTLADLLYRAGGTSMLAGLIWVPYYGVRSYRIWRKNLFAGAQPGKQAPKP